MLILLTGHIPGCAAHDIIMFDFIYALGFNPILTT